MRFNKAKAVRAAEKSLAQGKIPAAIQEYCRIVEEDSHDWTALNMLGDLYARTGKHEDASRCFASVAEHYRAQGFALKAIAMFKKILRLRPDDMSVAIALGELYGGQGLIVEARAQYLTIADAHTRAGRTHEALDTLKRIADLDPRNPEIRMRVAEGYAREGFADEAFAAFAEAGDRYTDRDEHEQALHAYNEALLLRSGDMRVLSGMTSAHSKLGTADEAVEVLEQATRDETFGGNQSELMTLLLGAQIEAENPLAAERTIEGMRSGVGAAAASARYPDVARLYLRAGDTAGGVRVLAQAMEQMLTERRDAELLDILQEILARDPEQRDALSIAARVYTWQHDEPMLQSTLERLAAAAEAAGLVDEECAALLRLVQLVPDNTIHRERLLLIGGDRFADALDPEAMSAEFAIAASDEVPTFESFMFTDTGFTDSSALADSSNASDVAHENRIADGDEDDATHNFEWNTTASAPPAPVASRDASASFADLNDEVDNSGSSVAESQTVGKAAYGEFDLNAAFNDSAPHATTKTNDGKGRNVVADSSDDGAEEERFAALLTGELESVDFYLAQGYTDVARDTLDMLERQYGAHPLIAERRAQLSPLMTDDSVDDASAFSPTTTQAAFELPTGSFVGMESGDSSSTTASSFDAEFTSFSSDGVVDEYATRIEHESAPTRAASSETAVDSFDSFAVDESAATVTESGGFDFVESSMSKVTPAAPAEPIIAKAETVAPGASGSALDYVPATELDAGLAAIFNEFRTAIEEEEPASSGDFETHYNLGIAYQEMGLLDEAIEEFQKATGLTAQADGTPRYLQCCNLLGHCFMQKNLPALAVMWFRKGLDAPGHTEDEYQALRFELANAYEADGDIDHAVKTFMQVYGVNVSYRGVAGKLRDLQQRAEVRV